MSKPPSARKNRNAFAANDESAQPDLYIVDPVKDSALEAYVRFRVSLHQAQITARRLERRQWHDKLLPPQE
jgi:hypothetical protein